MGTLGFTLSAPMTQDEKSFFRQLGVRIADARKSQNLTQQQLGEALRISQQMVASYEIGRRRVPISLLPKLARSLSLSVEALIGEDNKSASKRGPAPKIQQQLERVSSLPKAKQRFVSEMIDNMLAQAGRQ
jgi:transcriptional regulator with XRE-family HTH domain